MPFKENGEVIAEPRVNQTGIQKFVRRGENIAVGPSKEDHLAIANKNYLSLPADDAGVMDVDPDYIVVTGGSTTLNINKNSSDPARQETVRITQSLTSKQVISG